MKTLVSIFAGITFLVSSAILAQDQLPADDAEGHTASNDAPLEKRIESVKQAVMELNRDLLILEEELLFPTNTQMTVFVSMDIGEYFKLDSVKLKVDNRQVASYLYTDKQVEALFRGGVQRLYMGNIKSGDHEITAIFTGKGPMGQVYKRATTVTTSKSSSPLNLELKIVDSSARQQPEFSIKEWDL